MIKAVQYYTPVDPKVYLPIRVKDLFQVRLDPQDGLAHLECLKGKGGPHKLGISRVISSLFFLTSRLVHSVTLVCLIQGYQSSSR